MKTFSLLFLTVKSKNFGDDDGKNFSRSPNYIIHLNKGEQIFSGTLVKNCIFIQFLSLSFTRNQRSIQNKKQKEKIVAPTKENSLACLNVWRCVNSKLTKRI